MQQIVSPRSPQQSQSRQFQIFFRKPSISVLSPQMKKILTGTKLDFDDIEHIMAKCSCPQHLQERYDKIHEESKKAINKGQYKKAFNQYLKRSLQEFNIPLKDHLQLTQMRLYCCYKIISKFIQKITEGIKKDTKKLDRLFEQYFESLEMLEYIIDIFLQLHKIKDNYNKLSYDEKEKLESDEKEIIIELLPMISDINFSFYQDQLFHYSIKGLIKLYLFSRINKNKEMALGTINKIQSIITETEQQFVISNYDILRICGQAQLLIGNLYLESRKYEQSIKYYENSFNYYERCIQGYMIWFAQNKPENFTIKREKKFEKILKEFSIILNNWSQACEYLQNFSKAIESLRLGVWMSEKLFLYHDSTPVKVQLQDRLRLLNRKYDYFLKETHDINHVIKQSFPEEAKMIRQKYCIKQGIKNFEDDDEQSELFKNTDRNVNNDGQIILNQINNKIYNKFNYKDLNEHNYIITSRPKYKNINYDEEEQQNNKYNNSNFNSLTLKQLPGNTNNSGQKQFVKNNINGSDTNISTLSNTGQRNKQKHFTTFSNTYLSPSNDDITTQVSNHESNFQSNNLLQNNSNPYYQTRLETDMQFSNIDTIQENTISKQIKLFQSPNNKYQQGYSSKQSPRQKKYKKKKKPLSIEQSRKKKVLKQFDDKYIPKCLTSDKYFKKEFKAKFSSPNLAINPQQDNDLNQDYFIQTYQDFLQSPQTAKSQIKKADFEVERENLQQIKQKNVIHQKQFSENMMQKTASTQFYDFTTTTIPSQNNFQSLNSFHKIKSTDNLSPEKKYFPSSTQSNQTGILKNNTTNNKQSFFVSPNNNQLKNISNSNIPSSSRSAKKHFSYAPGQVSFNNNNQTSKLNLLEKQIDQKQQQVQKNQQDINNNHNKNIQIDNEISENIAKNGHNQEQNYKHLKIRQRSREQIFDKTDPEDKMNQFEKIQYRQKNPVKVNNLDDEMQKVIFEILQKDKLNLTLKQQYLPKFYKFLDLMQEENFDKKEFKFGTKMVEFKSLYNIIDPDQEKKVRDVNEHNINKVGQYLQFDKELETQGMHTKLNTHGKKAQLNKHALEQLKNEEKERQKQQQTNKLQRVLLNHKKTLNLNLVNQYHLSKNDKNKKRKNLESQNNLTSATNLEYYSNVNVRESKTSISSHNLLESGQNNQNTITNNQVQQSKKNQNQQISLVKKLQQNQKKKIKNMITDTLKDQNSNFDEQYNNFEGQKKSQDIIRKLISLNEQERENFKNIDFSPLIKQSSQMNNSKQHSTMIQSYNLSMNSQQQQQDSIKESSLQKQKYFSPRVKPQTAYMNPYSSQNQSPKNSNSESYSQNQKQLKDFIKEWPNQNSLASSTNGQFLKGKADRGFISIQELVKLAKIQKQKEIEKKQEKEKQSGLQQTPKRLSILQRGSVLGLPQNILSIGQAFMQKQLQENNSNKNIQSESTSHQQSLQLLNKND